MAHPVNLSERIAVYNLYRVFDRAMGLQLDGSDLSPALWIRIVWDAFQLGGTVLVCRHLLYSMERRVPESSNRLSIMDVMRSGPGAVLFMRRSRFCTSRGVIVIVSCMLSGADLMWWKDGGGVSGLKARGCHCWRKCWERVSAGIWQ